ncbi:hypothetical protein C8J57DRAFT_182243 [Mycena rebaudengoi]|nr:hypothetical protein C8J57DRAFT_182243 [Mycena rebaudengoi]
MVFLGLAVTHPQMFALSGNEVTLAVSTKVLPCSSMNHDINNYLQIVKLWILEAPLDTSFIAIKHLPARFLQRLIHCHGEDYEYVITDTMKTMGVSTAAQTAVRHLSSVPESDSHFLDMRNETFLVRMMVCTSDLAHSLLSNGVLRILIKTLSYATLESYTDEPETAAVMIWFVHNSCEVLQSAMTRGTGVAMCRQVLDFGILAPLLRADKWHAHLTPAHFPNAPYIHARLLIQTLATYTIYPCVLRAAAIAIEKVPVKLQANLDKAGPMRAAWQLFKDLVEKRLQVPGAPVGPFEPLICSNLFCPLVSPQDAGVASKRCSGCGDVLYCGSECQNVDWKNHKKVCKEMQAMNKRRPTVPPEETDFAHKVALHELEPHKNFILKK